MILHIILAAAMAVIVASNVYKATGSSYLGIAAFCFCVLLMNLAEYIKTTKRG